ncbi:MAG: hypothetical protein ACYCYR_17010 [Desulfobulbaceae bacterium]|jgi:hypothetical protein
MSAQTAQNVTPLKSRQDLEIIVSGKLERFDLVGKNKDIYQNIIVAPAKDEYSYPSRFCVMSRSRIGDKDKHVSVTATVRCRPWKDNSGSYRYPHELWAE